MIKRHRSLALLLLAMIGPALWAAYLFVVYGAQTLECLRFVAPGDGQPLTIVTLGSAAIVLGLLTLAAWRSKQRGSDKEVAGFTSAMSCELIILAAIGVVWIALASVFIPLCAPAN